MSNSTITSAGQTTTTGQTSLVSTTTTPTTTPLTTELITTSSVIAPTPATTQLVTSIISVSASNGTPQPPSTVIVTRISTPAPVTTGASTTATSSSASQTSDAALSAGAGGSKSSNNGGLSPAGKTAIAVVIPVVVIALLVLAGLFFWRRRNQRKLAEDERRKEMEAYGFNPNQDPSLPAVGGVAAAEMMEDQSGYRGWGTTSTSNRQASTTLSGGLTQPSDGGYDKGYSPGSPTQPTISDHSGDPIISHPRQSTMDSETIGAFGAAPLVGAGRSDIHRGPSNASSHYSVGDHSTHSGDAPIPATQDYYTDNAYFTPGPYENQYSQGGQPVIRENPARRNTRIQEANVFPQQGTGGIAQNF